MPVSLVDTHAHLDQKEFDSQREDVLRRAREAGVETMIAVGIDAESSRRCVDLAQSQEGVFAAIGIQPNYCAEAKPDDWDLITSLVAEQRVAAIGETGLDRHWDHCPFDLQQDYFDRHIRLAAKHDLPFIVHTRDCDEDVLQMLREAHARSGPLRGVMHSFCGAAETAAECVSLGMHVSFAGMVTFKKSGDLRAIAAEIPDDRVVIETDSPYLSPHPLRGKFPNEPARLVHTAACLAEARGASLEQFAAQSTANARQLFRLK
ncbi:MAG: TatD family hydrolase [Planctomycetales bacterium]